MSDRRARGAAVLLGLALLGGGMIWLLVGTSGRLLQDQPHRLGPELQPDEMIVIHIDQGESAAVIARALEQNDVIESARLFRVLASLMGVSNRLEPGDYEFTRGLSALTAVQRISKGITASRVVTIPEGWRSEEIGELLEREGVASAEAFRGALAEQYSATFLTAVPSGVPLEGFLFPASYGFARDSTARAAVEQMIDAFDQRYREEIEPRMVGATLTLFEAVTLASIVEREAQVPEERAVIASVFLNRLAEGIALQADPTVQYALGSDPASAAAFGYWKRDLTLADLSIDSPYNTYVYAGLPPGPIANPGLDSILAVLEPAETDYLYFVARADGSHVFASTLEEHQRNVCNIDPARPEC